MGALSITGQEAKRAPFEPLMQEIVFVPYGNVTAMRKAVSKQTAMVIVEPIQGENGVVVPPPGYLAGVRKICDSANALFAIDAVQTGMGRTGQWFGYESEAIMPDIITLAKGLGGGLPLGAMITVGSRVPAFKPGQHGSTFGGNPISCAAANAAIDFLIKKDLLKNICHHESRIKDALINTPGIAEVRGKGLLLGIVLTNPVAQKLIPIATASGLLLNATSENVIRIAPPLVVKKRQIEEFITIFKKCLKEVSHD